MSSVSVQPVSGHASAARARSRCCPPCSACPGSWPAPTASPLPAAW